MLLISNAHWRLFLFYTTHISFGCTPTLVALCKMICYLCILQVNRNVTWIVCQLPSPGKLFQKSVCLALSCSTKKAFWGTLVHRILLRTSIMEKNTDKNEKFPLLILAKVYLIKTTISWTFWEGWRTPRLGCFGAALWFLDHPACQLLGSWRYQSDLEEQP